MASTNSAGTSSNTAHPPVAMQDETLTTAALKALKIATLQHKNEMLRNRLDREVEASEFYRHYLNTLESNLKDLGLSEDHLVVLKGLTRPRPTEAHPDLRVSREQLELLRAYIANLDRVTQEARDAQLPDELIRVGLKAAFYKRFYD